ncbi:MAG: YceH family protein [Gammaproteobacteria bacterium]|nr:YceH family protein [Gammaproteobacteria bacterium]
MELNLNLSQLRVLGCLIEKQLTTPEYYPLTLSSLTNACNQKSNREPVMSLSESDVLDAIKVLEGKYLVREKQLPGSRVAKYEHKLTGTLTDQFGFKDSEIAVLSILFLRGPQTPGEIRTRTQRACDFADIHAVDQVLNNLTDKNGTQYVKALSRQPGKREIRYCHLFGSDELNNDLRDEEVNESTLSNESTDTKTHTQQEFEELRNEVTQIRNELDTLKAQMAQLIN